MSSDSKTGVYVASKRIEPGASVPDVDLTSNIHDFFDQRTLSSLICCGFIYVIRGELPKLGGCEEDACLDRRELYILAFVVDCFRFLRRYNQ
jgi:hypothetical protein